MNQPFQTYLYHFYQTDRGRPLWLQEKKLIDSALKKVFGYHLLQIGITSQESLLTASRVSHQTLVDAMPIACGKTAFVQADIDYLPFKTDSLDAILLPHTLEAVDDPYHLLREVDRLILPEGHLLITGFNSWGCAILRNRFGSQRNAFKSAHLLKMARVVDWLNLMGYDLEGIEHSAISCFGNQQQAEAWKGVEWCEKGLGRFGIDLGNVYCILAKKRIESLTPIGLNWKLSNWLPRRKGLVVANREPHTKQKHKSLCKNNCYEKS